MKGRERERERRGNGKGCSHPEISGSKSAAETSVHAVERGPWGGWKRGRWNRGWEGGGGG